MPQHRTSAPPHAVPVPPQIAQVAAASGLGQLVREYQPKRLNWFLLVFMILLGLFSLFILIGLWVLWTIARTPNLSKSAAARRIYLYEHGFVLVERPEDPQVYRWDGIDAVFQELVSTSYNGVPTGTKFLYTIIRRDGATAKVTPFWDGGMQFGTHVNERVSSALLPGAVAVMERGQGIQFGDMTLAMGGVAASRGSAPWAEVRRIRILNGYVGVNVQGKKMSLTKAAAADIPNLPLFLTLANRLQQASQTTR